MFGIDPQCVHLGLVCVDLADQLRLGAGVGIQLMHLRQPHVIETQQFDGGRVVGLYPLGDLVHYVGHAHQAALELPAIHRRRQPGLGPERATYQCDGDQHPGKYTADIEAKVVPARLTEQHHRQARQQHGQGQEQYGHYQRAAAGLLTVGDRVAGFELEHPGQVSRKGGHLLMLAAMKLNDDCARFL
ncbi:hypothetical protein [Pseudomonas synxantha]|nr:hypothetical protein [Pseudomonas synxantha]